MEKPRAEPTTPGVGQNTVEAQNGAPEMNQKDKVSYSCDINFAVLAIDLLSSLLSCSISGYIIVSYIKYVAIHKNVRN